MKKLFYNLLENSDISNNKKVAFDIFLAVIIVISIALIFFENESGSLPPFLEKVDMVVNIFFVIEFALRFYVSTNFRKDIKEHNLGYAIMGKVRWFFKINTIIDFLALIPIVQFFRIFRTLRFLRLFRLLKLYRSLKFFREFDRVITVLKGLNEEARIFYVLFTFILVLIPIVAFVLYIVEGEYTNSEFSTYGESLWFSIKTLGFGTDATHSFIGKLFGALLLFANITIFGFFISIISNKIQNVMEAIKSGKIGGTLKNTDHIVICGYTNSSEHVIEDLLKIESNRNNIVLITQQEIPDNFKGVIYLNGDYTELEVLEKANIKEAKTAVVFSEKNQNNSMRDVDLRTVLTIFHIETINRNIHTIAEINDEKNAKIIKEKIDGDEILYKEKIDSKIISNCIKHRYLSPMIYELFGDGKKERLYEGTLEELNLPTGISVKDIKIHFINKNSTFLGFIDKNEQAHLSPSNNTLIEAGSRIIVIV